MRNLSALTAVLLALASGAAVAANSGTSTSPVCGAGPADERSAGLDGDGDGVVDSEDWCPNTTLGDKVGANGCAAWAIPVHCQKGMTEAPLSARVVPVDEIAPAEAAPVLPARAAPEAPKDSDGDGVIDEDDKCPGTPKGTEVDGKGCAVISKVVLKGVNFATGSAKLLSGATATLRAVASAMKADESIKVEIEGHTDSVGDENRNQGLSERRAKSVKDFLVKEGIAADRLTTRGYGESQPVDTNETKEGRANNRRVVFKEL